MKKLTLSAVAVALSALFAGQALAADAPKTREQVRAELLEAQRAGDVIVNGELSLKENELYPHLYPKKAPVAGKTRAQVKAELAEAIAKGEMPRHEH